MTRVATNCEFGEEYIGISINVGKCKDECNWSLFQKSLVREIFAILSPMD